MRALWWGFLGPFDLISNSPWNCSTDTWCAAGILLKLGLGAWLDQRPACPSIKMKKSKLSHWTWEKEWKECHFSFETISLGKAFSSDPSPKPESDHIGYSSHSPANCCLVDLIDVSLAVKMPTKNLLMLLLLLILMMWIVLAQVCYRFGSWGLKFNLGRDSEARLGQYFELPDSRDADVWLIFLSWCTFEILKMKFDQDSCLTMAYDLDKQSKNLYF